MKRFSLVARTGNGSHAAPFRPTVAGTNWTTVADLGGFTLVKHSVPDGTAADATTLADLQIDKNGNPLTDVDATALSAPQVAALKAQLVAAGLNVASFDADGITDRRALLRFVLRRAAGWAPATFDRILRDFDVVDP